MITPMRHVTLVCRADDTEGLLHKLQDLGVLHVEFRNMATSSLEGVRMELDDVEEVTAHLSHREEGAVQISPETDGADPVKVVNDVRVWLERRHKILELDAHLDQEERMWRPFGDVDGGLLRQLVDYGLQVGFYKQSGAEVPLIPDGVTMQRAADGYFILLSLGDLPAELEGADRLRMPVRTPNTIATRRSFLAERRADIRKRLNQAVSHLPMLKKWQDQLLEEYHYLQASESMGHSQRLSYISGFVPSAQEQTVVAMAKNVGAGIQTRDPESGDPVPTHLEHKGIIKWIQPVLDFLGVSPGYNEVDVGWSFLVFLSLFTSMIIGDAGYGGLVLGIVLWGYLKKGWDHPFAKLMILMCGGTVFWGLLSGNVFGIVPIKNWMASWLPTVQWLDKADNFMKMCFLLGSIHLTIAHVWRAIRLKPALQALAHVGWICMTWTMFFVANNMVLGEAFPGMMSAVGVVGAVLIVLFSVPVDKLKEDGMSLVMLPLDIINNFVDVVSYVRLYAVGMATFALASSFNDMATGLGNGVFAMVGSALILLIGHGLNLVLAGMGVLVHGIRLNTLEFANHLGLAWGGIPYEPFKRQTQNEDFNPRTDTSMSPVQEQGDH